MQGGVEGFVLLLVKNQRIVRGEIFDFYRILPDFNLAVLVDDYLVLALGQGVLSRPHFDERKLVLVHRSLLPRAVSLVRQVDRPSLRILRRLQHIVWRKSQGLLV